MKRILFGLFAFCLMYSSAIAQTHSGDYEFTVYSNYWNNESASNGLFAPALGVGIPLISNIAFDSHPERQRDSIKLDLRAAWFPDANITSTLDAALVPLDFGLSYHYVQCDQLDLSIMGGGTYMIVDPDDDLKSLGARNPNPELDGSMGGYVGAGAGYDFMPNLGIFSNVYYRFIKFDVSGNGVNVDLGLRYRF